MGGQGPGGADQSSDQPAADAPQPQGVAGSPSEDQAPDAPAQIQPSTEGDQDPELTGEETGEQLEELGYQSKTGAAHERIKRLARERKTLAQENELLKQELLKRSIVPQAGQQNGQAQGNGKMPGPPPFDRPAPAADASDEEKLDYLIEKKAHEKAWQQTARLGQELVQALGPVLRDTLESRREKEWDSLSPSLERAGTSREELEPLVEQALKAEPTRSLRSVTFDIMDRMNLIGGNGAPVPPASTKPGANGKPRVPGTAQPAKPKAPTRADSLQAIRERVGSNDPVGARNLLGNLLLKEQDRGNARR